LNHAYIDGTKIEANANRYTWVWKKSCIRNRDKVFEKLSLLIDSMNKEVLGFLGIKLEKREVKISIRLEDYLYDVSLSQDRLIKVCQKGTLHK